MNNIICILTVQPQIIQLKNETTFENGKATLICEAEGEPIPEITWKRAIDGITFSEGDKVNQPLQYLNIHCFATLHKQKVNLQKLKLILSEIERN